MLSRRDFIKMIGTFSVMLTPLNKLIRKIPSVSQHGPRQEGELYEGFVLLDLDAPMPFFIECVSSPIVCLEEETEALDPDVIAYRGEALWFDGIENLKDSIDFRLFTFGSLPHKMVFLQGYVLRFVSTGEVWEARLDFGFEENREPLISLSARPIFPRPYPVWPVLTFPKKEAGEFILDNEYIVRKPEKVDFTPKRGVMLPTEQGYTLQWIKKGVLYTMFMEYDGWRGDPEKVGRSLVEN